MDTRTKRIKRAIRFGWVGILLFLQVGPGATSGAIQAVSFPGQVASEGVAPPSSEPLTFNVVQSEIHGADDPIETDGSEEAATEASWPMAAANPERTSWTPEEVRGVLKPLWYRPVEPYIPAKVQIIAANNILYVSTAKGLYALDANTGDIKWVYATEMPLGNSPTITNGVAYVGGLDNKLHAVNALTGQGLWTFEADAGFDTNPLVVGELVYAGNRDGYMYAVYAHESPNRGMLFWKFRTDGPIHFSAAYKNNTIYFASDDSYAYALNAQTGAPIWTPVKLPAGDGFHSWWPVIAGHAVIFSGSRGYRVLTPPQTDWSTLILTKYDDGYNVPMGPQLPDGSIDATQAFQYLESKPWRRSYYILDLATGQEITYDFDHDGKPEYAPLLNAGTNSGNRYPVVTGPDSTIYTFNVFSGSKYGQGIAGWKLGAKSITTPGSNLSSGDEPLGYATGGSVMYWNQCCDRTGGAFDLTSGQKWSYFVYNLTSLIPGYDVQYAGTDEAKAVAVFGGWNGVYGSHGDQNPPIPYQGKVYMHRSNAVIAWSPTGGATALPMARTVAVPAMRRSVDTVALGQKLVVEIQSILSAGHLRPGFGVLGNFAGSARSQVGDNFADYWSNPLDTILVLTRALPYLPSNLQQSLRAFIQNEFANYSPCDYTHIGWRDGADRQAFDLPPEVTQDMANWRPNMYSTYDFEGWAGPDWKWTPHTFYALWKYALAFGGAKEIFDTCKERNDQPVLWTPPSDDILAQYPFAHNAWIAGYMGYLELEKLAGYPEEADKRTTLNRLLSLRVTNFAKNNPWGPDAHNDGQVLSVARNFLFLTPELGKYLHDHALGKVRSAFDEYKDVAPYWFVTKFEATYNEGVMQPLYDYNALFAAKSWIFNEPARELVKYLDVPAFARGDLFYIQNLILTLEAQEAPDITKTASSLTADQNDVITYTLTIGNLGVELTQTLSITVTDLLPTGLTHSGGLCASSQGSVPTCSSTGVMWTGGLSTTAPMIISYTAQITTPQPAALTNQMQVDAGSYGVYTRTVTIIANPLQVYLPLVLKGAWG